MITITDKIGTLAKQIPSVGDTGEGFTAAELRDKEGLENKSNNLNKLV